MERLRLYRPENAVDELDDPRARFEDLSAYYPVTAQASPRGDGRPAAPAAVSSAPVAGAAAVGGSPALTVLVIVALSLFLLHRT
jgi:hypothetical protein